MAGQTVSFDPEAEEVLDLMREWHASRIAKLEMIIAIKDSDSLVLQGANGNKVELTGNARKGYIAGLQLAIELFTPFPFEIELVSEEESD